MVLMLISLVAYKCGVIVSGTCTDSHTYYVDTQKRVYLKRNTGMLQTNFFVWSMYMYMYIQSGGSKQVLIHWVLVMYKLCC